MDKIVEQVLEELNKRKMIFKQTNVKRTEEWWQLQNSWDLRKAIELAVQKAKNPFTPSELEIIKFGVEMSLKIDDCYNPNYDETKFKILLKKFEGLK